MRKLDVIQKYKKILINIIKKNDVHKIGRKNKFDISFYLDYILRVLFNGEYWNTINCAGCHRSTIRKKFYKWRDMNIFKKAHEKLKLIYNKRRTIKYLFIDSAIIQNMNCSDKNKINYHYKMKTKKTTKLSIICDNNYVVNSFEISSPKIHDSRLTKPLIKKIICKLKTKPKLIGDKGYISKRLKHKLIKNKKRIQLITPLRKNQKNSKKINKKNKRILNKRFKVEVLFGILKRTYKRLQLIFDRCMKNYETFFIMASTCQFIKAISRR